MRTVTKRLFCTFTTSTPKVFLDPANHLNGENLSQTELIDNQQFCGVEPGKKQELPKVKEVDVFEFEKIQNNGAEFQLIDVREVYEYNIANLDGELIPLKSVSEFANKISRDKKVIVHCRSGVRSAKAIKELEDSFGFENLYNLKGGILAYAKEIDQSLATY